MHSCRLAREMLIYGTSPKGRRAFPDFPHRHMLDILTSIVITVRVELVLLKFCLLTRHPENSPTQHTGTTVEIRYQFAAPRKNQGAIVRLNSNLKINGVLRWTFRSISLLKLLLRQTESKQYIYSHIIRSFRVG